MAKMCPTDGSMLTIYVYHIIFIVYSNIPRVPMEKLDNSLEAATSTMV